MRMLMTSLGAWDTIETGQRHKHGITFPLAILQAILLEAGYPEPDVWEGDTRPTGPWDVLLISAMDPRHFWEVPKLLRSVGCPVRSDARGESDPVVVMGGQAATAPAPAEAFIDVVYVGEAEAHAAAMMEAVTGPGSRAQRLARAALVPGVMVPALLERDQVVQQVWSDDIAVTLRERLWVNHRDIHRVEVARGCKSRCGFCVLGWRAPYRENSAEAIGAALKVTREMGVREVHLSAGDAEGHSEIDAIRRTVGHLGLRDHGWTGRLDTMRDCSVSAGKHFAFGIEGPSHRLRRLAGKPRLTAEYIVDEMRAYWGAGGRRAMWHLIGGLPGEGEADAEEFEHLLEEVAGVAAESGQRQYLDIGRQPFGPLPHTPMQWCRPGLSTERIGRVVARHVGGHRLMVTDKAGQSFRAALYNVLVMRGGREVTPLVEAGAPRLPEHPAAAMATWRSWVVSHGLDPDHYLSDWDPAAPTPWSHVRSMADHETLLRAYERVRRIASS